MNVELFKQGMLFFVEDITTDNNTIFQGQHTPKKKRIWLIVSNNKNNKHSDQLSMCPIYTRDKSTLPTQVYFENNGRPQVICTENITTIPKQYVHKNCYAGTISKEIMEKVRKALGVQFSDTDTNTEANLENYVLLHTKREFLKKFDEMNITQLISDTVTSQIINRLFDNNIMTNTPDTAAKQSDDIADIEVPLDNTTETPAKRKHRKHGKVIPNDKCLEFYNDCCTLTADALYEKWSEYGVINDNHDISKKRYSIKQRLLKLGIVV